MRTRAGTTTALAAAVLLFLAGCTEEAPPAADPPATDGSDSEEPVVAAEVGLATTSLGDILVDREGMTLYMFDPDEQGPSTCYDVCASTWPPYVVDPAAIAGDDVDAMSLATREREDGSRQVTYNGWPLYYYAQDAAPGDVNGQGVNGVWFVLDADGEPIR